MKKTLLGLGSIGAIITPVVSVVACGGLNEEVTSLEKKPTTTINNINDASKRVISTKTFTALKLISGSKHTADELGITLPTVSAGTKLTLGIVSIIGEHASVAYILTPIDSSKHTLTINSGILDITPIKISIDNSKDAILSLISTKSLGDLNNLGAGEHDATTLGITLPSVTLGTTLTLGTTAINGDKITVSYTLAPTDSSLNTVSTTSGTLTVTPAKTNIDNTADSKKTLTSRKTLAQLQTVTSGHLDAPTLGITLPSVTSGTTLTLDQIAIANKVVTVHIH